MPLSLGPSPTSPTQSRLHLDPLGHHTHRTLARHAPPRDAAGAWQVLDQRLRRSPLVTVERAVVLLAAAAATGCRYGTALFASRALVAGLHPDQVRQVRDGVTVDDARLDTLARFTRQVACSLPTDELDVRVLAEAGYPATTALDVRVGVAFIAHTLRMHSHASAAA